MEGEHIQDSTMQGGNALAESSEEAEATLMIKSLRSKVTAWVRFTNMTKQYVSIFWLNYQGEKVSRPCLDA